MQTTVNFIMWVTIAIFAFLFFPIAIVLGYGMYAGWYDISPKHKFNKPVQRTLDGVVFQKQTCQNCGVVIEHNTWENTVVVWDANGQELDPQTVDPMYC